MFDPVAKHESFFEFAIRSDDACVWSPLGARSDDKPTAIEKSIYKRISRFESKRRTVLPTVCCPNKQVSESCFDQIIDAAWRS